MFYKFATLDGHEYKDFDLTAACSFCCLQASRTVLLTEISEQYWVAYNALTSTRVTKSIFSISGLTDKVAHDFETVWKLFITVSTI